MIFTKYEKRTSELHWLLTTRYCKIKIRGLQPFFVVSKIKNRDLIPEQNHLSFSNTDIYRSLINRHALLVKRKKEEKDGEKNKDDLQFSYIILIHRERWPPGERSKWGWCLHRHAWYTWVIPSSPSAHQSSSKLLRPWSLSTLQIPERELRPIFGFFSILASFNVRNLGRDK